MRFGSGTNPVTVFRLRGRGPGRRSAAIATCAAALLLSGCTTPAPPVATASSSPASARFERDVVYRTVDGQRLALDACLPVPRRPSPTLVLIHGGGFTTGNRGELGEACAAAAAAGLAAFTIDYRLAPARYPAQVQDAAAAVDWLQQRAQRDRFALRPDRVALLGASAGAVIAAELAVRTPRSPLPAGRLRGVVLMSGVYDTDGPLGDLTRATRDYLDCGDDGPTCRSRGREVSAIHWVSADDPPMLVINSTHEVTPVGQPRAFANALQRAGVPHETLIVSGTAHAQGVFDTHPEVGGEVLAFLQRHLVAGG